MKKLPSFFINLTLVLAIAINAVPYMPQYTVHADAPAANWPAQPELYGTAACLIEASTGTVLFEKNIDKKMYPASITKILTALVTLENANLDDEVTFSEECVNSIVYGDANMGMEAGEILPLEDCLYGLMLKSANEVATALAEHTGGSVKKFAEMMNKRAAEAGAKNSHFMNANGLHDDNHYVTAYDMCMITRAAIQNPVFVSIVNSTSYTVSASNKKGPFTIYNRHKMMFENSGFYYEGVFGGKTGFTDQAGTTLVTYAKKNGMTLIAVVLQSNGYNVYNDTRLLFDYGFDNFKLVNVAKNETRFQEDSVSYTDSLAPIFGHSSSSSPYIDKDAYVVIPKDAKFKNLKSSISYDVKDASSSEEPIASINYKYGKRPVGSAFILISTQNPEDVTQNMTQSGENATDKSADKEQVSATQPDKDNSNAANSKQKKRLFKVNKSTIRNIVIAVAIIIILIVIIVLIRKKQKQLNEIRAQKRRRNRDI